MIKLTLALVISAFSVIAQPAKRNLQLNLNFESIIDKDYTPATWMKHGDGHTVKIDFSEKYEGKSSLLIKSRADRLEKDSVMVIVNRIDAIYRGKVIELSGYLKLDSLDGRAGISLVIGGKNGTIASEEMRGFNLHGTKAWSKYSIKLPLPDSATFIYFGVYQTGVGKLWADHLKLLIDNKDFSLAEVKTAYLKRPEIENNPVLAMAEAFFSKFGKIVVSDSLLQDSVSHVSVVPPAFGFNSFYKKYLNASGLPIVGSEDISDDAFYKTREVILMMLKKVPSIKNKLIENNARIAIIGRNELTTDLPEYKELDKSMNTRARGFGAMVTFPLTSCGEENVLCLSNDPYNGEDILIHEFAHTIHLLGISFIDHDFDHKLNNIYSQALNEGLWKNTYAISSPGEYLAEGIQSWFNVNKEVKVTDGIHNDVNTRNKLKLYDPRLYALISIYFSDDQKNVSCHGQRRRDKYGAPWLIEDK